MCGVYGVILHETKQATPTEIIKQLVTSLAVLSADRGTDSTGLAHVRWDGSVQMCKDVMPSYRMVRGRRWARVLSECDSQTRMFMGHTRRASYGAIVPGNAHPFQFVNEHGSLVGTHNGGITNHNTIGPTPPYSTDSANVFWALASGGQEKWADLLFELEGSYTLVWSFKGNVHMARNDWAPLWVANIVDFPGTVYASTQHILMAACSIAGVAITRIRELAKGIIYTWEDDGMAITEYEREWSTWEGSVKKFWREPSSLAYRLSFDEFGDVVTDLTIETSKCYRFCSECKQQSEFAFERKVYGKLVCDWCWTTAQRMLETTGTWPLSQQTALVS